MINPLVFEEGLVFDGRSVVISICGLFFGPISAIISALMSISLRIYQGGVGAIMGVSVITASAIIGVFFYYSWKLKNRKISSLFLLIFGIIVHIAMLALAFTLPKTNALAVIRNLGFAIITFYPLATVLIGKILSDQEVRTTALEAIRERESLFRNLSESSPVGIFRLSPQGVITYLNQQAATIVGLQDQDKSSRILFDFCHNPTQSIIDNWSNFIVNGQFLDYELQIKRPDNSLLWVYLQVRPETDELGQIKGYVGTAVDIDERKLLIQALNQSKEKLKEQNEEYLAINEELTETNNTLKERELQLTQQNKSLAEATHKAEESDKLKSSFLANMSHEIRTPMNAIVGFSEILLNKNLPQAKQTRFLNVLNTSCHQLLKVINDVLDISKIETGQMTIISEAFNLNKVMKDIQTMFLYHPKNNNNIIDIVSTISETQSHIICDETKVRQVLTNLVGNAIKFTKNGKIEIGYQIKNEFLHFFIRDNGIGISTENQDIIFDRFRQAEIPTSKDYGGTGLGLTISKAFVELLGGQIWLESEINKGSTFFFTLPYKPTNTNSSTTSQSLAEKISFNNYTILIAEDEVANFYYLQELLEETKATIIHAKNGLEAVNEVSTNNEISIVLMDIKMPVLNGLEATKRIKSIKTDLPVIAVTAYALEGDKEKGFLAGCDGYLSKPIDKDALLNTIREKIKKPQQT